MSVGAVFQVGGLNLRRDARPGGSRTRVRPRPEGATHGGPGSGPARADATFSNGSLTYDDRGRLRRRVLADGTVNRFEYADRRLISAVFSDDDEVGFAYDARGRVSSVSEPGCRTAYVYDADGRLAETAREIDGAVFTLRLDERGRPHSLGLPGGELLRLEAPRPLTVQPPAPERLRFDAAGNVVAAGARTFRYDAEDRLVEAWDPRYGATRYVYDAMGNRAARRGAEGDADYGYDRAGRLVHSRSNGRDTAELRYDAHGNVVGKREAGRRWRYAYDARQQLAAVYLDDRLVARYRYDFLGRRIERRGPAGTVRYHHDPAGDLVAITDARGRWLVAFPAGGRCALLRGRDGIRQFALETDHLGSTRRILAAGGDVVWCADYEAFGRPRGPLPPFQCPLFAGHLWDAETGLYLCGARYYDPDTGRFLSPDPFTGGAGDPHLFRPAGRRGPALRMPAPARRSHRYAYASNNPATFQDPTGLSVWGTIGQTVLAVIWSSVWTLVGAATTILNWIFQFPLFGHFYLPLYGLDGVASGRIGSAAMVNVGGLGPSPLVLANVLFARRGLVAELTDAEEYVVPVEAHREPRQLRDGRTAYFEHLLRHTVQCNFSGPFWPFVYAFASHDLEKDAVRESGFSPIAEPTLTLAPDLVLGPPEPGNNYHAVVVGGQRPYTAELSDPAMGALEDFTDETRFSEALYIPEYRPGSYTITIRDAAGFSDTRGLRIAEIELRTFALTRPTRLFIDEISDPRRPTLRLVDQAAATVDVRVRPGGAAVFLEAPAQADGTPNLDVTPTNGRGELQAVIRPHAAPAAGVGPPADFDLNIRPWTATTDDPLRRVVVRSMATITVMIQAHVVRRDDGTRTFTDAEIDAMVDRANQIFAQAGIRFVLRTNKRFIDDWDLRVVRLTNCGAHTVTPDDTDLLQWRPTPPGPFTGNMNHRFNDPNVIHAFFIRDFDPSNCAVAYAHDNYMVVSRKRGATTFAHELGHCLGLNHPDAESPAPGELSKRLMRGGESNRGEPYLIANRAHPARPGNGADETLTVRTRALNWPGP